MPHHHGAAFVIGAISAELGLKAVLLKPIVHGVVDAESAAALIARMALAHKDEGFTKILVDLLAAHGGVDLRSHERVTPGKTLWEELTDVRKKRNLVVHQGEVASHAEAQLAIDVAACILESQFPALVNRRGLHLHGVRVCDTPPNVLGEHPIP